MLVEGILDIGTGIEDVVARLRCELAEAGGTEKVDPRGAVNRWLARRQSNMTLKLASFFFTKNALQCSRAFRPNLKSPRRTPSLMNHT